MATYPELRAVAEGAWHVVERPERPLIKVVDTTCSRARGAEETLAAIREELAAGHLEANVLTVGCWGLCYLEPLVEIDRPGRPRILYHDITAERVRQLIQGTLVEDGFAESLAVAAVGQEGPGIPALSYLRFIAGQERRLMANCGVIDPEDIDHYVARGGYEGLAKALQKSPEEVIREVTDSGLWGRGGAAFPTGRKWEFLRGAKGSPRYLVCNADEGDPGSFVNRTLLEGDPHLIIEGMIIAAHATGASYGYIYIRDEYPLSVGRMEKILADARERGLLGGNILDSGFSYDMEVVRGAGSYVCGEETGLIASVEDLRGMPKIRPPYPAQAGIFDKPTNVNNVETYANVPLILRRGAQWYASAGSRNHKGTKMFSLSGQIQRPGIVEVPLGMPLSDVILKMGNGAPEGHTIKAIQPGGPLSGIVPASDLDIPLEPDAFRERGMLMGSGGLVVLDDGNCIVDLCLSFEHFAEDESCGRCTTCHGGTQRLVEILRRIADGMGREEDIEIMNLLSKAMVWSNCAHGQAAPTAIMSALRFFQEDLMDHIRERRCRVRVCRGLVRYEVLGPSERLPEAIAICPTAAIVPDADSYRVDQTLCIKCDACREMAPEAIEVGDAFALAPADAGAG
jgi:NADH-quinone oxidoreductase subunit F